MHRQAIPYNSQLASDVPSQMPQKGDHLRRLNAAGEELEVEIPNRDAGDGGQGLPIERILQYRSLASRSPSADSVWPFAQTALVDKYYGSALLAGFFLSSASALSSSVG